ncbi:MAG: pectate lyase [Deltaproteobacteria bacterium]|nr:pectate lyase [Nannocystaceae bacterium]
MANTDSRPALLLSAIVAASCAADSGAAADAGNDASTTTMGGSASDAGTAAASSSGDDGSSSHADAEASGDGSSDAGPSSSASSDEGSSTGDGGSRGCGGDTPLGWASENGGTSGGAGGPTTMVDDAAELLALAAAEGPQIIVVTGEITLDETLFIASDKTIEGAPGGATIHGTLQIDGSARAPVANVIVRNLFIEGSQGPDEDTFTMQFARNVWVDHCDIADGADGNLDITHGSSFVTVSWTRFHYTDAAPAAEHRFCNLIGHSDDNADEDEEALDVTMHHDWWSDGVVERMPRVRFGRVHVLNNLFDSPDTNYAVRAGVGAEVLVEANYFDATPNPHEIFDAGAEIVAIDNTYAGTSGAQDQDGDAFEPPYDYVADAADDVPQRVEACAGPQ